MSNFREDLKPVRDLPESALIDAMQSIDSHLRSLLAEGPNPRRLTCGVCQAFKKAGQWNRAITFKGLHNPYWVVFAWHEVPKIEMLVADDQWHGKLANEVYERCIATYRTAGWTGEAEPANA